MAYTEFRKSYGDFEIVIPAIDFSALNGDQAIEAVNALRGYELPWNMDNWVCNHLKVNELWDAARCIREAIDPLNRGLEGFIFESMKWKSMQVLFQPSTTAGRVLRIEWCKHMAKEIEREFGL